jgi:tight adherence protein C
MSALQVSVATLLLAATAAIGAYAALFGSRRAIEDRITDMAVKMRVAYGPGAEAGAIEEGSVARALFRWVSQRLPAPRLDTPQGEKLSQTLVQAGFLRSSAVRTFQTVRLGASICGVVGGLAAAMVLSTPGAKVILFMACGAAAGAFVPSFYLTRKARNRQQAIAGQLSDVLDLLVVCVEAGLGLSEAIKVVGSEAERQNQEIGVELALVSGELTAGSSLGQALRNFAERTAVDDIKPLAATLIQSEQLGAQIAPALRAISDSLRTARRMRAEEAAQKTTVKILFPLVLFILPAMMSVIVGPAMIQIMKALNR